MSTLMRNLKPWEKSTGPVTTEGKRRASLNGNASKLKGANGSQVPQEQREIQAERPVEPVIEVPVSLPEELTRHSGLLEYRALRRSIG